MGKKHKKKRRGNQVDEAEELRRRVKEEAPASGSSNIGDASAVKNFADLPISFKTKAGLEKKKFTGMTDIQMACIPHALAGRDVLASARTGSGKTLAFLVPLLEDLYREDWSNLDGCGAIVVAPTRELCVQIFQVLKAVGSMHDLSAGLLIGGKDKESETSMISRMTILVASPGRLLHHLETSSGFTTDGVRMLVLDEADRILDMGFSATLTAILEYLPPKRQTMLFSATQTKSVKQLARLSLQTPEWLFVDDKRAAEADGEGGGEDAAEGGGEGSAGLMPGKLSQSWMEVPLAGKLDVLWSFIKTHLRHKVIVFLTSCKQVKFVYEALRRQRPGIPLLCLHGKQKQGKRLEVFEQFSNKPNAVLFATDIAARGLDFPDVDWVVQVDCPEDVSEYIHRAGRTARYRSGGKALLFVLPSEKAFVEKLAQAKVPIKKTRVDPSKTLCIRPALQAAIAEDSELKFTAQRALVSYVRAVHLRKDKDVFDVTALPLHEYATAMGLPNVPRLRFVDKGSGGKGNMRLKQLKAEIEAEKLGVRTPAKFNEPAQEGGEEMSLPLRQGEREAVTKADRLLKRKNMGVLCEAYTKLNGEEEAGGKKKKKKSTKKDKSKGKAGVLDDEDDDDDDDTGGVLTKKRKTGDESIPVPVPASVALAAQGKTGRVKKIKEGSNKFNTKRAFDSDDDSDADDGAGGAPLDTAAQHAKYIASVKSDLKSARELDMSIDKTRIRSKHIKVRRQEKAFNIESRGGSVGGGMDADAGVQLGSYQDGGGGEYDDEEGDGNDGGRHDMTDDDDDGSESDSDDDSDRWPTVGDDSGDDDEDKPADLQAQALALLERRSGL